MDFDKQMYRYTRRKRCLPLIVAVLGILQVLSAAGCTGPKASRPSPLGAESEGIATAVRDMGAGGGSFVVVHSLSGAYNIVELNFRGCNVDDWCLRRLEGLTPIIGLDLSETKVANDGMAIV